MKIAINNTATIGATPTEKDGLYMKIEEAFITIYERGKKAKKAVRYSFDQTLTVLTAHINHN